MQTGPLFWRGGGWGFQESDVRMETWVSKGAISRQENSKVSAKPGGRNAFGVFQQRQGGQSAGAQSSRVERGDQVQEAGVGSWSQRAWLDVLYRGAGLHSLWGGKSVEGFEEEVSFWFCTGGRSLGCFEERG